MKFGGDGKDARRFVRSVVDAFEAVKDHHKNGTYQLNFAIAIPNGISGMTDSEVMSYLDKVNSIVGKFAETDALTMQLDVVRYTDHTDINTQIMEQTKVRYEASKQLEESVQKGQDIAAAASAEKLEKAASKSKSEARRKAIQLAK